MKILKLVKSQNQDILRYFDFASLQVKIQSADNWYLSIMLSHKYQSGAILEWTYYRLHMQKSSVIHTLLQHII